MNAVIPAIVCLIAYALGYWLYAGWLSRKVFSLDDRRITPAHAFDDGMDYVPTNRFVLFGHHYASIAGLAPMLGPAVAVIWGWLPAMLWVVGGAIMIGCVHDFSAIVLSVRARGQSIGKVAEGIIGKRAKTLFHLIIFFLVALAMGVFVYVIANLFSPKMYPAAITPTGGLMLIAALAGWLTYRQKVSWVLVTIVGFLLLLALVAVSLHPAFVTAIGLDDPAHTLSLTGWEYVLLGYAFLASILPVWFLLQPRDFLNSLLLYVGIIGIFAGFFMLDPHFQAPAFVLAPPGAPSAYPFVFIIIACGAASGFHSLVSSGTTAKQIDRESDARLIGYGGMIGESLLALVAVLATTAGFASDQAWLDAYGSWAQAQGLAVTLSHFIEGSARFLQATGVSHEFAVSFIALIAVSYALTSLDSATRLLRYNIEEMGETLRAGLGAQGVTGRWVGLILGNRYISSLLAVGAIAFFAFYKIDGKAAGLALWQLFGTTNQLLAGLALLAASLYLLQRRRFHWVATIPMVFMMVTTLKAMVSNMLEFWQKTEWPLFAVSAILLILAVWLMVEAILAVRRTLRSKVLPPLDIFPASEDCAAEPG